MLSYAGVSLIDATAEVDAWVRANIDPAWTEFWGARDWPGWGAQTLSSARWGLPPGPALLNVLDWPAWGACRFASGLFLIHSDALEQVRSACYPSGTLAPALLVIDDGNYSVAASLYMLPPRPLALADPDDAAVKSLWLLPLVDQRYFWWYKPAAPTVVAGTTTWADLYALLAAALGITLSVDAVDAAYLTPPDLREAHGRPACLWLDAVAASVGQRVVRSLDGTVRAMASANSAALHAGNVGGWERLAGGDLALGPDAGGRDLPGELPEKVRVTFGNANANHLDYPPPPWAADVTLASLSLGALFPPGLKFSGTKCLRAGALARGGGTTPGNTSDLTALARRAAADWYTHRAGRAAARYAGVVQWDMEGLTDRVRHEHRDGRISTVVTRGPHLEHGEDLLQGGADCSGQFFPARLVKREGAVYTWTRVGKYGGSTDAYDVYGGSGTAYEMNGRDLYVRDVTGAGGAGNSLADVVLVRLRGVKDDGTPVYEFDGTPRQLYVRITDDTVYPYPAVLSLWFGPGGGSEGSAGGWVDDTDVVYVLTLAGAQNTASGPPIASNSTTYADRLRKNERYAASPTNAPYFGVAAKYYLVQAPGVAAAGFYYSSSGGASYPAGDPLAVGPVLHLLAPPAGSAGTQGRFQTFLFDAASGFKIVATDHTTESEPYQYSGAGCRVTIQAADSAGGGLGGTQGLPGIVTAYDQNFVGLKGFASGIWVDGFAGVRFSTLGTAQITSLYGLSGVGYPNENLFFRVPDGSGSSDPFLGSRPYLHLHSGGGHPSLRLAGSDDSGGGGGFSDGTGTGGLVFYGGLFSGGTLAAPSLTVGTSPVTGGSSGELLYQNAGYLGAAALSTFLAAAGGITFGLA